MGTDKTFYCWVKLSAASAAAAAAADAEQADGELSPQNKRPPSMKALPASGLAAELVDIMYKRPPYTRGLAQRLAANPDPTDSFQFSGAALAGWWDMAGGVGGDLKDGLAQAAICAMTGTGEEAKQWIDSEAGRRWRKGAHTYFLMCFAAGSDA